MSYSVKYLNTKTKQEMSQSDVEHLLEIRRYIDNVFDYKAMTIFSVKLSLFRNMSKKHSDLQTYTEHTDMHRIYLDEAIAFTSDQLTFYVTNLEDVASYYDMYEEVLAVFKRAWYSKVDYIVRNLRYEMWRNISKISTDEIINRSSYKFDIKNTKSFNRFTTLDIYMMYRSLLPSKIRESFMNDETYLKTIRLVFEEIIKSSTRDCYNMFMFVNELKDEKVAEHISQYELHIRNLVFYLFDTMKKERGSNSIYTILMYSVLLFSLSPFADYIIRELREIINQDETRFIVENLSPFASIETLDEIESIFDDYRDIDNDLLMLLYELVINVRKFKEDERKTIIDYDNEYRRIVIEFIVDKNKEILKKDSYNALAFKLRMTTNISKKLSENLVSYDEYDIEEILQVLENETIDRARYLTFGQNFFALLTYRILSRESDRKMIFDFITKRLTVSICIEFAIYVAKVKVNNHCGTFYNDLIVYILSISHETYLKEITTKDFVGDHNFVKNNIRNKIAIDNRLYDYLSTLRDSKKLKGPCYFQLIDLIDKLQKL